MVNTGSGHMLLAFASPEERALPFEAHDGMPHDVPPAGPDQRLDNPAAPDLDAVLQLLIAEGRDRSGASRSTPAAGFCLHSQAKFCRCQASPSRKGATPAAWRAAQKTKLTQAGERRHALAQRPRHHRHDPVPLLAPVFEGAAGSGLAGSRIACAPVVQGNIWYSMSGGNGPVGSVLGGTGIAVSARSTYQREATDFACWGASGAVQRGPYAVAGGQPGHAAAAERIAHGLVAHHPAGPAIADINRMFRDSL